jgi:WD40 repeat protein
VVKGSIAFVALAAASYQAKWLLVLSHEGAVNSAAFSPDGARIVTASDDRTAHIWDAGVGREIAVLRGHEGSAATRSIAHWF